MYGICRNDISIVQLESSPEYLSLAQHFRKIEIIYKGKIGLSFGCCHLPSHCQNDTQNQFLFCTLFRHLGLGIRNRERNLLHFKLKPWFFRFFSIQIFQRFNFLLVSGNYSFRTHCPRHALLRTQRPKTRKS